MCHKSWWTQNAMGYYRLWVITVWVISGLTVSDEADDSSEIAAIDVTQHCKVWKLCICFCFNRKMVISISN